MTKSELNTIEKAPETIQLVTFMVGDITLGIEIDQVQEINHQLEVTRVPESSPMIHGVVNLRGDVVTVLNPHRILGLPSADCKQGQRNLILNVGGERVGVVVDQVSDILTVPSSELAPRPSNVRSVDRQFIDSVYIRQDEIVVVLNASQLVAAVEQKAETV